MKRSLIKWKNCNTKNDATILNKMLNETDNILRPGDVVVYCATFRVIMGGSSSKPTKPATENNANSINNGNIIESIEQDILNEVLLLKIVIVLKAIHILIVLRTGENNSEVCKEIVVQQNHS